MLSVKDRLLLTLALGKDILENIGTLGGFIGASYEQMYGFVPSKYKRHNFSASLSYALKNREIEKIVKKGQVYYRLTHKGEKKLISDFPLVSFQKKPWDGKWRILIYDIPEKHKRIRDLLRRKIISLGFGQLQESVYLSPYKIEKEMSLFLEKYNLSKRVLFLISDNILAGGDKFLAEEVWKLSALNKSYENLLRQINQLGKGEKGEERYIKAKYLEIMHKDPFLPKNLLPVPWYGEQVNSEMQRYF